MRRTGLAGGLIFFVAVAIATDARASLMRVQHACELQQPLPPPPVPPPPPPTDPGAPPAPPDAAPPGEPPKPPPAAPGDPAAPPTEPGTDPAAPPPEPPPVPPTPPPEPPPTAPPPPVAPAPAPPPIAPAPVTTPYAAPGPDLGAAPPAEEDPPPPERSLGIQIGAGLNTRLGGDTSGIPEDEPVGLAYGAGVWFAPDRLWSIGLSYQRLGLGGGETSVGENSISVQRDLDTFWLGGRAYPLRSDTMGLYVALALGASWQSVSASGSRDGGIGGVNPPQAFACEASDGPGFALGGGVGLDVDMSRNVAFLAEVGGSGHQLTSDPIEGCAPGSGSVTGLGASIGFMYRFDLDDEPRRTTAQRRISR